MAGLIVDRRPSAALQAAMQGQGPRERLALDLVKRGELVAACLDPTMGGVATSIAKVLLHPSSLFRSKIRHNGSSSSSYTASMR